MTNAMWKPASGLTNPKRDAPVILVADDDDDFREVLTGLLEQLGFRVVAAADGLWALRMALQLSPVLIILDQRMPGLQGSDVALRLRQSGVTAPIAFVSAALSLARNAAEIERSMSLIKPFSLSELELLLVRAGLEPKGLG